MNGISDDDLKEALKLNERLANRLCPNRRDDLVSAGHEAIMQASKNFAAAKGSFKNHVYPYLSRNQRRAFTNLVQPFNVPHTVSDYIKKIDALGYSHFSIEATEGWEAPLPNENESPIIGDLREALDSLPSDEREIVHAYFYEGYCSREAGAKFGVSDRNFQKRLNGIKKKLKKLLAPRPVKTFSVKRQRRMELLRGANLSHLSDLKKRIVAGYVDGRSLEEIAATLSITRYKTTAILGNVIKGLAGASTR